MPARPAETTAHIESLVDFIATSPTSYHAAATVADQLRAAGYREQVETEAWSTEPGGHLLVRDGSVIAWQIPDQVPPAALEFRIAGSHTDSPGFKLKPQLERTSVGWQELAVEVYGGPLLNSWLDRELGVAGRLINAAGEQRLVRTGPIARIPQLAIHLDRSVNDTGVKLERQRHTQPVWGVGSAQSVKDHLAELADWSASDIAGHELYLFDAARGDRFGTDQQFLACGRMDNLISVHSSLTALGGRTAEGSVVPVLAAFDHEEVGSRTRSGAAGPLLETVLRRIMAAHGGSDDDLHRALARSMFISADAGHAVHPNYPEHHDPDHRPILNGGVLLKINAGQAYATDAPGTAAWAGYCHDAGVAVQPFVSNNDRPCGSTVGPITATRLGITTVDVGVPLLSMHSAREMCGVDDPVALTRALQQFWA